MSDTLNCPECGEPLYVIHRRAGKLIEPMGQHQVANVYWQAECHNDDCQWVSAKRSTEFALIEFVHSEREPASTD